MADNKMAPGSVHDGRVVEEPAGYDHPETEPIPAQGDFVPVDAEARRDRERKDRRDVDPPAGEPVADQTPEPRAGEAADTDWRTVDSVSDTDSRTVDSAAGSQVVELPPVGAPDEPMPGSPAGEPSDRPAGTPAGAAEEAPADATFFAGDAAGRFRDRWRDLQADFVDDPARAVRGADELVDEIMRELADRKHDLEGRVRSGSGDTEELRAAMREYRSFFNQLLNA
jgi:hypothetical protein